MECRLIAGHRGENVDMHEIQSLKASEAAWLLIELSRVTVAVRQRGFCAGPLSAQDLRLADGIMKRVRSRAPLARMRQISAMRAHRRSGHDDACAVFGLPLGAIDAVLRTWAGTEAARFLGDAVAETIHEVISGSWAHTPPDVVLRHVIGRRITVCAPADDVMAN